MFPQLILQKQSYAAMSMGSFTTLILCSHLLFITIVCAELNTISRDQSITGNETMVSADGRFELGFFSPGDPKSWYLGIWFKKISARTVVWVANRETSLPNSSATLQLTDKGILRLLDSNERMVWSSSPISPKLVQKPVAQLLDSGNFVVTDAANVDNESEYFVWQSFDHPGNTLLPGMKLGRNIVTGSDKFLTSWKNYEDPSPGYFAFRVEPNGYPQLTLLYRSEIKLRVGTWDGLRFSGTTAHPLYQVVFVFNDKEVYYSYKLLNSSVLSRTILSSDGAVRRYMWSEEKQDWSLYPTGPIDNCDAYARCGAYGSCNVVNSALCQCMDGFVPKSREEWDVMDWSNGCVRRARLNCSDDVFLKYSGLKLPDTQKSRFNQTMNLQECEMICKKNCSCTAYANLDVRGSGCLLWFGDLIDIRLYSQDGQDLYVRMAASEAVQRIGQGASKHNKKKQVVIIASSVFAGMLVFGMLICILCKNKPINKQGDTSTKNKEEDFELPLFDFTAIATATNNFSTENKLGEGGFGPVYKGVLKDGQEIAVKRLSRDSSQGLNEFRNEVLCIAKLQHRNLVKLVGCCIEEENMLLYEYMPNRSLDFFIFDQMQRKLLNWQTRFDIINGIARGLLYLHQDSRLRIVHRDLKAGNILLDHDMNPKVSDFGLARSFGGNETKANTNRVVGTYGYMSPEYAIDGIFSTKSDVYSYGVLVLEIVSGKQNRGFYHPDHFHNLLGHAWKLFNEGRSLELIDELVENPCNLSEVSRSIHVGLLCVQRSPEDRPNMPSVVLMLGSENALPQPKEPGFFTERELFEAESWTYRNESSSVNDTTQTMFSGR